MSLQRLAYFINVFPKLSETFIAVEMAELKRRGVDLRIFSLRTPTETLRHPLVESAGLLEVTNYHSAEFSAALREFAPDLLHAHFATEPTAAARALASELNVPFTFTAHGYDIHRKPPPDFSARAEAAAAVITVSNANASCLEKTFKVPRDKIKIIPCGVDTEYFKPLHSPPPACPPLALCVARHVAVKNLGLLLRALAILRDGGVSFRAVLIGDGPCRPELEGLSMSLGLEGIVEFRGAATQDEVLPWLQRARVAVLSSNNEGMPVSLMEAAACGLPVVATAVGGVPELVRDGVTGFLSPTEPEPFASALRRLLTEANLAQQMGAAARAEALARFSVRRQVDSLLSVWNSLCPCVR